MCLGGEWGGWEAPFLRVLREALRGHQDRQAEGAVRRLQGGGRDAAVWPHLLARCLEAHICESNFNAFNVFNVFFFNVLMFF